MPICKPCKAYYFDGIWEKDEEGKFNYCGWCAQGGELICCTLEDCPNAFCIKCIKRNLGRNSFSRIQDNDNWKCFECKPKQLRDLRLLYYSILQFWNHIDDKLAKKEKAKAEREKAKNRNDCLTKTFQLAGQCQSLYKNFVTKNLDAWSKNPNFDSEEEKFKGAQDFAKFLALSRKNLNQLETRFFEYLDEDLGTNKERTEKLKKVTLDLDAISNGHLEDIVKKKEKVKYQVLQSSDEEESSSKKKKPIVNGKPIEEVNLSDESGGSDELKSSSSGKLRI